MKIHARDVLALRDRLEEILTQHTGQERERVHVDMERDKFMTAAEAVSYGTADRILEGRRLPGNARRVAGLG